MSRNATTNVLGAIGSVLLASTMAHAQSVSLYETSGFDGTYVYATGVLQYSATQGCTWCSTAYHTYQQTVGITGPNYEYTSCYFNYGYPAASTLNQQCEAELPENDEAGDFTISDNPIVTCSVVGTFIDANISDKVTVEFSSYVALSQTPNIYNQCFWNTSGQGCPGTCGQDHQSNGYAGQCYTTPNKYKQCKDEIKNGVCDRRTLCVGTPDQGMCT